MIGGAGRSFQFITLSSPHPTKGKFSAMGSWKEKKNEQKEEIVNTGTKLRMRHEDVYNFRLLLSCKE